MRPVAAGRGRFSSAGRGKGVAQAGQRGGADQLLGCGSAGRRRGASPRVWKMNINRIVRGLSLAAILAFGPGASVGCRPCTQNGGPAGGGPGPIFGSFVSAGGGG